MKFDINKLDSLEIYIDDLTLFEIDEMAQLGIIKDISNLEVNGKWFNYAVVDLAFLRAKQLENELGIRWYI